MRETNEKSSKLEAGGIETLRMVRMNKWTDLQPVVGVGGGLDMGREGKEKNQDHPQVPDSSEVWLVGAIYESGETWMENRFMG